MKFFDLHCDTLTCALQKNKSLYDNNFHVSLKKAQKYSPYIGCMAIWIPDELRGSSAAKWFDDCVNKLYSEVKALGDSVKICRHKQDFEDLSLKPKIILTVEGGAALCGDINRIKYLSDAGVKIMTLTWNGSCEIGDGIGVENARGLTQFGKNAVKEMEKAGIIVDVSHASRALFDDVTQIAAVPFIATHSNSYKLCPHKRNLTDEQFQVIKNRSGIVGVTFCRDFLNDKKSADTQDIFKHVEHFLSLGGENTVAIGSDFDGADMPEKTKGLESIEDLYEYFLMKNYSETLLDKIFFDNARNFILQFI